MREVIKMPNQKQKDSSRNFRRGIGWFYAGRVDIGNFHAIFVKELGLRGHWEDEDGDWIPDDEVIKKLRQAGWTVMERDEHSRILVKARDTGKGKVKEYQYW